MRFILLVGSFILKNVEELMNREKFHHNGFNKFFALWIGQMVSSIGSGISAFGLGIYVYEQTGLATATTTVTLLAFLPSVLLAPFAGVLADRYDRRLLMILGDGLSIPGLSYILWHTLQGDATVSQVGIGVFISSIFVSLLQPSYSATITDLLTPDEYAKANGLVQLANASKYLISPVVAGFLMKYSSLSLLLMLDISTVVITMAITLLIRKDIQTKPRTEENHFLSEFRDGVRTLYGNKGVFLLVLLCMALTFFIGIIQTLSTPMILGFAPKETVGIVLSLSASGMLLSSFLISTLSIKKDYIRMLSRSLCCAGFFMMGFGLRANFYFVTVFGFLFFAMMPPANASLDVLVRSNIDNSVQGRVWGLIGVLSQLGYLFAYAFSGVLSDFVFTPMLLENGLLSKSVGRLIGVGTGRGSAFLIILAGASLLLFAARMQKISVLQKLEVK